MANPNSLQLYLCSLAALILTVRSLRYGSHPEFITAHNAAREAVGVGPMMWNRTLALNAREYALKQVSLGCEMKHSGGIYGENLAAGSWDMTGTQASKLWTDERSFYDYVADECRSGEQCGHYTQMVWRDSVRLGCARRKCGNGWMFVVCNYDPPGNYIGESPY